MSVQLYIDPECRLSKVPYEVPNNTHYVKYEDYARLKAELRSRAIDSLSDIGQLGEQSAEIAHLKSELAMEKENEDRIVRLWQQANNEVHGQRSQIAALIDNQTSLKAEVERLRKAGDAMERSLAFEYPDSPKVKDWNAAKEGKPSV